MNPYIYTNGANPGNLRPKQTTSRWHCYEVSFPSAYPTPYAEYNTVWGEYYRPRQPGRSPLAILLHGMGDQSIIPCRLLARSLASQGVAAFVLYLVVHSRRLPESIKSRLPNLTAEEWFQTYQISVINARQVADWAVTRPELDPERLAVLGLSLGGLVSAITMGVDPRFGAGVFLVAAGNGEKMFWKSRSQEYKKLAQYNEEEYQSNQRLYAQYLARLEKEGFEQVVPAKKSYLNDPLTFAYRLRGRPLLMVNALWDEYIPREAVREMWAACGKPPLVWLPASHSSIWAWYPLISRKISRFLRDAFGDTSDRVVRYQP